MVKVSEEHIQKIARLTVKSDLLAVRNALGQIFNALNGPDFAPNEMQNAEIVMAEVLNNIVEHAYAEQTGDIDITVCQIDSHLRFHLVDDGHAMPNEKLPSGLLPQTDPLMGFPEGGFGWFLIRALAKDMAYERIGGRNHLTFRIPLKLSA